MMNNHVLDILDGLMSSDERRRQHSEHIYNTSMSSITLRCEILSATMISRLEEEKKIQQQQQFHQYHRFWIQLQFMAILLRRSIVQLDIADFVRYYRPIAERLIRAFLLSLSSSSLTITSSACAGGSGFDSGPPHASSAVASNATTSIGHCLAEVCSVLSILDYRHSGGRSGDGGDGGEGVHDPAGEKKDACQQLMEQIVQVTIDKAIQAGDETVLKLWIAIAERTPRVFVENSCVMNALPSLTTNVLTKSGGDGQQLGLVLRLLVVAAGATVRDADGSDNHVLYSSVSNKKGTMMTTIDSNCVASQLGLSCLLPLLQHYQQLICRGTTGSATLYSTIEPMLESLATAADVVPIVLAGHPIVLNAVVDTMMTLLHQPPHQPNRWMRTSVDPEAAGDDDDDDDAAMIQLQAVQVIANLISHPAVKSFYLTDASIRHKLMGDCNAVMICLRHMCTGIDTDTENDGWANDPPPFGSDDDDDDDDDDLDFITMGGTWEGDAIAEYAQELLEIQLRALGGAVATGIVLPTCESWLSIDEAHFDTKNNNTSSGLDSAMERCYKVRAALAAIQTCLIAAPLSCMPHIDPIIKAALHWATSAALEAHSNKIGDHCHANELLLRIQLQAVLLLAVLCEVSSSQVRSLCSIVLETFARTSHSSCNKVAAAACLGIFSYCRTLARAAEDDDDDDGDGNEMEELSEHEEHLYPFVSDLVNALLSNPLRRLELLEANLQLGSYDADNVMGAVAVQLRALRATACLARACRPAYFVPHYKNIVPSLATLATQQPRMTIGQRQLEYEAILVALQGSALECVTTIGQSLGGKYFESTFAPDARAILQTIVPALQQRKPGCATESNDDSGNMSLVPLDQLLRACSRIATAMGPDYSPACDIVVPHLIGRAQEPPDLTFSEGNEADLEKDIQIDKDSGTHSMTVAVPGRGIMKATIHISSMKQMATAARVLHDHAKALGVAFVPYAPACIDSFAPLVEFRYSSEVRTTAALAISVLFEELCHGLSDGSSRELVNKYLPIMIAPLARQIPQENPRSGGYSTENLFALSQSLCNILQCFYVLILDRSSICGSVFAGTLSIQDTKVVVQMTMKALRYCLERRSKLDGVNAAGFHEGEDEMKHNAMLLEEEQNLLATLVDSVGYCIKLYRHEFVPIFESEVATVLGPFMQNSSSRDPRGMLSAVCLYDDCIEHCGGEAARKFAIPLVEGILLAMKELNYKTDQDLQQAAIYGIAQLSRYAPRSVLEPCLQQILHYLFAIVASERKADTANVVIYENAVSALASLVLFPSAPFLPSGVIDQDMALKIFLDSLPLREDEDEARICHAAFCDLVEAGKLGETTSSSAASLLGYGEQLIGIIGQTMALVEEGEDIASPQTQERFGAILWRVHQLQNKRQSGFAGCTDFERALRILDTKTQALLQQMMEQHVRRTLNVVSP